MKKINILSAFIIFLLSFQLHAQNDCNKWALGVDFDVMLPRTDIKTTGYGINYGVNFDIFYLGHNGSTVSFQPGMRFRGGMSRIQSRDVILEQPLNATGTTRIYNTDVDLKFVARFLFFQNNNVRPYFELTAGYRASGTTQDVEANEEAFGFVESSERLTNKFSPSVGFGTGVLIGLSDRLDLNIRASFDKTDQMNYVDIRDRTSIVEYETKDAYTANFAIGILGRIGCYSDDNQDYERRNRNSGYEKKGTPVKIKTQKQTQDQG